MTLSVDLITRINDRIGIDLAELQFLIREIEGAERALVALAEKEQDEISERLQTGLDGIGWQIFEVRIALEQIVRQLQETARYE